MHCSSLLFLVGGGRDPRYPPNKVIFWNEALGKEVAELEFREKVRGLACRRRWLAVALRRRVVVFEIGESVKRYGEWDTYDNSRGEHVVPCQPRGHVRTLTGSARVRCHRDCHRCIFDAACGARTPTWTRATHTPSALSSVRPHRTTTSRPPAPTTSNGEAFAFGHRGAQHGHHDPRRDAVGEAARDDVRPRDASPRVGYCYREAGTRTATRDGSGGDLRRRFSPGRGGNMRLERQGHHPRLFVGRSRCRSLVSVIISARARAILLTAKRFLLEIGSRNCPR